MQVPDIKRKKIAHLCNMNTQSIGQIVKKTWQESGLSQKEFADAMDMSVRNLQYFFEKNDIHISQLAKASAVLQKDFITAYLSLPKKDDDKYDYRKIYSQQADLVEEILEKYIPSSNIPQSSNQISFSIHLKGDFNKVAEEMSNFLHLVKEEAEQRGFKFV